MVGVTEPGKMAGWVAAAGDGHPRQAGRLRVRADLTDAGGHDGRRTTRRRGCVDRHVDAGAATASRSACDGASTDLRGAAARGVPARQHALARARRPARRAGRAGRRRRAGLPGVVPRRAALRRRAGAAVDDAHGRRPRRRSSPTPAPASPCVSPAYAGHVDAIAAADAELRHAVVIGDAGRRRSGARRTPGRRSPTPTEAPVAATTAGLAGVLALQLGHDRHAEGRDAPPRQPAGDRRDLRPRRCSTSAPTTAACRSPSCSSPTASATR